MINCLLKWTDVIKSRRNIVGLSRWKKWPNCRYSDNRYSTRDPRDKLCNTGETVDIIRWFMLTASGSASRFDRYTTFSPWNDYRIADSRRRKWPGFIARASYCAPPRSRKWLQLITSFPVACYARIWCMTCLRNHLLLPDRKRRMLDWGKILRLSNYLRNIPSEKVKRVPRRIDARARAL